MSAQDAAPPAADPGGPLAPRRRIEVVDALRGAALLGILQVNIQSFTWGPGDVLGYLQQPPQAAESVLYFLQAAFVEGKCYPIFAFLFGLGSALQLRRMQARPGARPGAARARQLRRLAFLLVLGVAHGWLLYFGDVLQVYAICGALVLLATPPTVAMRPRWLLRLAWAGALATLLGLLLPLLAGDGDPLPAAATTGRAVADRADGPDRPSERAADPTDAMHSAIGRSHAIYTRAGYIEQLAQRGSDLLAQQAGSVLTFWPQVVCLYALGALAARLGWLRHPRRHRRVWRGALRLGLVVGLPCALLGAALDLALARDAPGAVGDWNGVVATLGGLLAAAYVALALDGLQRPGATALRAWLAAAGRASLSNYLLQSLLMGFLLSGWGLQWGATATRGGLALLGLAIFGLQAMASRWWLREHDHGPMEALWRRWTYTGG